MWSLGPNEENCVYVEPRSKCPFVRSFPEDKQCVAELFIPPPPALNSLLHVVSDPDPDLDP
jgi:hypothetical protein